MRVHEHVGPDRDFQGKMAFGALRPVSVSAARQRLEAGAAKAPRGRRGQVSFIISRVKMLHLLETPPYGARTVPKRGFTGHGRAGGERVAVGDRRVWYQRAAQGGRVRSSASRAGVR